MNNMDMIGKVKNAFLGITIFAYLTAITYLVLAFVVNNNMFDALGYSEGTFDSILLFHAGLFCCFLLLFSMCGLCSIRTSNKICLGLFGVLFFIGFLGFLFYGIASVLVQSMGENFCTNINTSNTGGYTFYEDMYYTEIAPYIVASDNEYYSKVDHIMCTDICPCYAGDNNENYDIYQDIAEEYLNIYGRTHDPDSEDYIYLKWSDDVEESYISYVGCQNDLLAHAGSPDPVLNNDELKLIQYFESTHLCSFLCQQHLFYLTKSIGGGAPQGKCCDAFWPQAEDFLTIAAIFMLAAAAELLLFFIYNTILCCAQDKPDDGTEIEMINQNNMQKQNMGMGGPERLEDLGAENTGVQDFAYQPQGPGYQGDNLGGGYGAGGRNGGLGGRNGRF